MFMDESAFGGSDDESMDSRDVLAGESQRQVYTGSGSTGGAVARPGSASLPVRPVSARTWGASQPQAQQAPAQQFSAYNNDLFGDEGAEAEASNVLKPTQAQTAGAQQRVQQQRALAAQKRRERNMMSGMVVQNEVSRPGSAGPSRPGSALGSRPGTPAMRGQMGGGGGGGAAGGGPPPSAGEMQQRQAMSAATEGMGGMSLRQQYGKAGSGMGGQDGAEEVEVELAAQGLSSVYDPTAEARNGGGRAGGSGGGGGAAAGAASGGGSGPPAKLKALKADDVDTSDMRQFLNNPGPTKGPIQCYIKRDKGKAKMYPTYTLYLEGSGSPGGEGGKFLLSARKRKKSKSSNYLISLDEEDMSRQSGNYFGKLRSNFIGTEFTLYDKGVKPSEAVDNNGISQLSARAELAAVMYQYNVLGTRGPRKMTSMIAAVNEQTGQREVFRPMDDEEKMLSRFKEDDTQGMVVMRNKPPKWNEQMQAYCLNFNGRVTHASVKNFQLVSEDNKDHVILQFGKVGNDTFTMDYQYPISALQAFSICLTSFDGKLACE